VTILSYSEVQCLSIPGVIADQTSFSIKLGDSVYACANSDISKCKYKQLEAGSFPKIESMDHISGDLVLTGKDFFTSGYEAHVSVAGIEADSVIINSGTQVTAKWTLGIPPITLSTPILWFK